MKLINKYKINRGDDRKAMLIAFANAGYPVHVEATSVLYMTHDKDYWIVVTSEDTISGAAKKNETIDK